MSPSYADMKEDHYSGKHRQVGYRQKKKIALVVLILILNQVVWVVMVPIHKEMI